MINKIKTPIGDRMKRYEKVYETHLIPHMPTIIRIDGKAFHTYTKRIKCQKPFDGELRMAMVMTLISLMENIQNAVLGYHQSDELSILLIDYPNLNTEQWFGGDVQKIVSVGASMTTGFFFSKSRECFSEETIDLAKNLDPAFFDARVFQLPEQEVVNYFIWRQQDWTRNSINMLGRAYFSSKELIGKNVSNVQDMLMEHYHVNWNDCYTWEKRGTCVIRDNNIVVPDHDTPIFTQNRNYINKYFQEEV